MFLTHKTEIFPNAEQVKQIEINFGLRRFFFNKTIMTSRTMQTIFEELV